MALKFDIHGRYGFFKNHESNSVYMSYQFIHKPSVLGILGCIVGLDGWRQMKQHEGKLEYYEVFKDTKISIIPKSSYFNVFYETINNSTGFVNIDASKKGGATANIKRQILQDPCYTIIIQKEGISKEYYDKLKEMLFKGESTYPICLGNNTYKANITNVEEIELENINDNDDLIVESLILENKIEEVYEESEDGIEQYESHTLLPIDYNIDTDYGHKKDKVCFSNHYIKVKKDCKLYKWNDKIYYFM